MGSKEPSLPYWQMNVPEASRQASCPDFLLNIPQKDIEILLTPDDAYHTLTWPEVLQTVETNRLDRFQRVPSDLRRYLEFNYGLKQQYGSVMTFILKERVGWEQPIVAKGKPFEVESDVCVRVNDWGYGIVPEVVHLVVWTKFDIEENEDGDLTDKARGEIQGYMDRVFGEKMKKEHITWFKNWRSLKSVHAVEHFHVMLFDPDPDFINEVTHGDVPLSARV